MVHSALNNDRFIKQLRFFGAAFFIIVTNIISHFDKVFKSCQDIKTRRRKFPQRGFSLFNSYGTRVVVVALSFADVVVSATEESVFAVVVVVVVASLAAADEESSVAGFEAAPALVVV